MDTIENLCRRRRLPPRPPPPPPLLSPPPSQPAAGAARAGGASAGSPPLAPEGARRDSRSSRSPDPSQDGGDHTLRWTKETYADTWRGGVRSGQHQSSVGECGRSTRHALPTSHPFPSKPIPHPNPVWMGVFGHCGRPPVSRRQLFHIFPTSAILVGISLWGGGQRFQTRMGFVGHSLGSWSRSGSLGIAPASP